MVARVGVRLSRCSMMKMLEKSCPHLAACSLQGGDWQHQPTPRCLDEVDFDPNAESCRGPKVAFLKQSKWSQATGKDKLPDCFGLLLIGFDHPQEIFLLPFGCISDAVPICGSHRLIHFHNGGGVLFVDIQREVLGACFSESALETLCHFAGNHIWLSGGSLPLERSWSWAACLGNFHKGRVVMLFANFSAIDTRWMCMLQSSFHLFPMSVCNDFEVCTLCQIRTFAKGWMEVSQDASLWILRQWPYDFWRFPFFLLGIQGYDYMVPPCNPAAHDQKIWYVVPGFFLSLGAAKWMMSSACLCCPATFYPKIVICNQLFTVNICPWTLSLMEQIPPCCKHVWYD